MSQDKAGQRNLFDHDILLEVSYWSAFEFIVLGKYNSFMYGHFKSV